MSMKKLILAVVSGILFALGWPTYGFPLFLFFAFIPLLFIEEELRVSNSKRKKLSLFGLSYISFFIWNVFTTSWLWYADPFGAGFAILVNSLLMSTVMVVYHLVAQRTQPFRALLFFLTLWLSFEKLHLYWEFSWPWLNLGNAFSEYTTWIQWYEYTGTFGGSLWILFSNVFLFTSIKRYLAEKQTSILKKTLVKFSLVLLIPIGISIGLYFDYEPSKRQVNAIVLQPNIDPYSEKYNLSNETVLEDLIALSRTKLTDSTDFILAPETVIAKNVRLNQFNNSLIKTKMKRFVDAHPHVNFLTGISFYEAFSDPTKVRSQSNLYKKNLWIDDYNSAILIKHNDAKFQRYDKSKLVVGVENFPYQSVLKPLIGDAMIDLGGTVMMKTTQKERGIFEGVDPSHKAAPIICYESVYGEFVTGYIRNGANFLAIITNDAWWSNTLGHKQHLSYAKLRAIETRKAIARSANTGISAFINAKGEIVKRLDYEKKGALSETIEVNDKITFYVIAGDYIPRIAIFIMLFVFLIEMFRVKRL